MTSARTYRRGRIVLGIDQGTTGTAALVYHEIEGIIGKGYAPVSQVYPRPGWVEQDPDGIWQSVLLAAGEAISSASIRPAEIVAIGLANQRETVIIWERATGLPVANAIGWQCRRTSDTCRAMRESGLEPEIRAATGLLLDPYFSATKLAWILDNVDGLRSRAERGDVLAGTVDTWLLWRLTGGGVHATDPSNASRTLLYNLHDQAWSERLMGLFRVPAKILPRILPSAGAFGVTMNLIQGIAAGIPITGVLGDQQAALLGQGCTLPGQAKATYGTGAFLLVNTGSRPPLASSLLGTVAWDLGIGPVYALEGSVFTAGAAIKWMEEIGMISSPQDANLQALSVEDSGGVYFVPAFTGLGAPYWDPEARGTITGLSRGTCREHIVRAGLESIAYQVADIAEAVHREAGLPITELRADGGVSASDFVMQFQANVLDAEVTCGSMVESTALGAIRAAGIGIGLWSLDEPVRLTGDPARIFKPRLAPQARTALLAGWKRAVERSINRAHEHTDSVSTTEAS